MRKAVKSYTVKGKNVAKNISNMSMQLQVILACATSVIIVSVFLRFKCKQLFLPTSDLIVNLRMT
jgi:hypothetical protein